ncbi:MAG TPA: N-6 DNA methylase, partial [Kiritimatiellia bacterium]|nr:N-6 DNA methylase [Kiritimatiellia bacterium]
MNAGDNSALGKYLSEVRRLYRLGEATEHSYRGHLQNLFADIFPALRLVNEPARIECGAPDLALLRRDLVIGYIEAKDIGKDLGREEKSAQMSRYLPALDNLILTDYLEFRFYRSGKPTQSIRVAEIQGGKFVGRPENHETFLRLIGDFAQWKGVQIRSAAVLAERLAKKARLMRDIFRQVLAKDPTPDNPLQEQLAAFKQILLHDLDAETFADIYAQTIAYGMFAARLHDPTPDDFSRQEAAALVPKSNPFLRNLFGSIAAVDLDDRVAWVVDDLVEIFRTVDLKDILADFGKATAQEDPFMHFYETFLAAYDPALRKGCGVYYTPQPVVRFIVRAVDQILKTSFGLPAGLADNATVVKPVPVEGDSARGGRDKFIERTFHKVQLLDPACGTGTFLAEVVRHIRDAFAGQEGLWPNYVEKDLIPRINGFEILMASYAICHLKLELLLRQTGYDPQSLSRRFNVFLANSLEDADPATGTLFASWLSREAREANRVKRDSPVMVVLGNPPYAVSSSNRSDWIQTLIADYKKNLNEKKLNLDDDYIKFIRMGQHYVEKNGQGILAYISNNSFIDGITHRQMRRSLMEAFDDIYILDLHGSAKKKETAPDGSKDENVFDIMTGVSINLFVKTGKKSAGQLANVHHHELFGRREKKYAALESADFYALPWAKLEPVEPSLFFVPKDFSLQQSYDHGFALLELMKEYASGIETKCDSLSIHFTRDALKKVMDDFASLDLATLKSIYTGSKDTAGWNFADAKNSIQTDHFDFLQITYRPFDTRETVLTKSSGGFIGRPRFEMMRHFLSGKNHGLLLLRQSRNGGVENVFITQHIIGKDAISSLDRCTVFPLYLYSDDGATRTPNLDPALVEKIAAGMGLRFVPEATGEEGTFSPLDLLDYIYAVLHTPSYREKYKEFLKIDFPRVPDPADAAQFRRLAAIGAELRALHLMESPRLDNPPYTFPVAGDNIVLKPVFKDHKVWINKTQYVGNVPKEVWRFFIGGYQPAQKWL